MDMPSRYTILHQDAPDAAKNSSACSDIPFASRRAALKRTRMPHVIAPLLTNRAWLPGCAETEKQLESLVDVSELARRHLSEDAADAALVDRSEMIDEAVGGFRQAARPPNCPKT